jgi:hypothetical protein
MNKQAQEFAELANQFRAAGDEQQAAHFDALAGRYLSEAATADTTPARRLDAAGPATRQVRFDSEDSGHARRQAMADAWRRPLQHTSTQKNPVAMNTAGTDDVPPLNERGPDTEPQASYLDQYAGARRKPLQHSTRDVETNAPNPARQYQDELEQKAAAPLDRHANPGAK